METNISNIQLFDFEKGLARFTHSLNLDIEERDLVRETLMNAVNSRTSYKTDGYLKSCTDTMLRKAFINNYKRIVMQTPPVNHEKDLFATPVDESETEQESLFNNIIRNIEQLNYRLMEPFKMYVEGYSYTEIAGKLKLKFETVAKRIFLARSQLILKKI